MRKVLILLGMVLVTGCNSSDEKNVAPVLGANFFVTETDVAISDKLKASDMNKDALKFTLTSQPENGAVNVAANGDFTYTPAPEFTGDDSFAITVSDGEFTVSGTVSIEIKVANVSFLSYSRQAFNQNATDKPLAVNGRVFMQDSNNTADYADLLTGN
ncbi:hypothetical protein GCM10010919_04010 [Alishewanella longhuensis]|uniref:Cadherin repeat domain-containing protein n=1 Tax=Alishewanella longhuensis TaxID=1091037 RepID=A0ABQ3KYI0_9ALTE|nr:Ig-like domain-containing protein [Alishewanella longhuensis]GHG60504.1 hypothetical protein GCM10010919_04010 [Alishewanella longhuensis]